MSRRGTFGYTKSYSARRFVSSPLSDMVWPYMLYPAVSISRTLCSPDFLYPGHSGHYVSEPLFCIFCLRTICIRTLAVHNVGVPWICRGGDYALLFIHRGLWSALRMQILVLPNLQYNMLFTDYLLTVTLSLTCVHVRQIMCSINASFGQACHSRKWVLHLCLLPNVYSAIDVHVLPPVLSAKHCLCLFKGTVQRDFLSPIFSRMDSY
jgi:hypothetical protein